MDWVRWYKTQTGKKWKKEDTEEAYLSAIDGLSNKEKDTARLLYDSYLKQKETIDDASEKISDLERESAKAQKQNEILAKAVQEKSKEDRLARGKTEAQAYFEERDLAEKLADYKKEEREKTNALADEKAKSANKRIKEEQSAVNRKVTPNERKPNKRKVRRLKTAKKG